MKIYIGADHAGYELKEKLKVFLSELGHDVEDKGAHKFDPEDDYPDFIRAVAEAVSKDSEHSRGIIIGGSGQGEAMAANKVPKVRAALFYGARIPYEAADIKGRESLDPFEIVILARRHNDANVLSLGARFIVESEAKKAVDLWLSTPFEGGRHQRRVEKIDANG